MINKFKRCFIRSFSTFIYTAINVAFIILFAILACHSNTLLWFSFLDNNESVVELVVTISITVVTLLVTLEIAIKQLLFRSSLLKYFSHIGRNVISITLFAILFLFNCFSNTFQLRLFTYLSSISFVVTTLAFFIFDLFNTNNRKVVKKEIKKAVKNIKNGKDPSTSFNKIKEFLRDSLLMSDLKMFDTIILSSRQVLHELLSNKYTLDEKNKDDKYTSTILDQIYYLHYLSFKTAKIDTLEYVLKKIIFSKCLMLDDFFKYDSSTLINYSLEDLEDFFVDISKTEEVLRFFVYFFFLSKNTNLLERLSFLYKLSEICIFSKDIFCDEIYISIIAKISDKSIKPTVNLYKQFFKSFEHYISYKEINPYFISKVLIDLYEFSSDDEQIDIINDFILFTKEGDFFVKPTYANYLAVYNFIHDSSKKHHELSSEKYFKIHLTNSLAYITNSKNVDKIEFLDLSKDILNGICDEYGKVLYFAIKNGDSSFVKYYLSNIVDFASSLSISDRTTQELILKIFSRLLLNLTDIESKDKITSIVYDFEIILSDWDKNKCISENLSESIIKTIFDIIDFYISDMSPYSSEVFELTNLLFVNRNNKDILSFVLADKSNYLSLVSEKIYKIGILAVEYGNDEIIKKSSNFIGWCLLESIKTCQDTFYKNIYKKYACSLFKTLISYNYNENTIIFVATLFVINLTCCLCYKEFLPQYKFAVSEIEYNLNKCELEYIKKSIVLRKKDDWTLIDNYQNGLSKLTELLNKKINKQNKE